MTVVLRIILLVLVLALLGLILTFLKRDKLSLKYALIWIFVALMLLVFALFPQLIEFLSNLCGIKTSSNFIFVLEAVFVLMLLISLSLIVSDQAKRILRLTQTVALLEKRIRELEEKAENR